MTSTVPPCRSIYMSRRVLRNPATAYGRQSEAQLEERRATAIATAASESIELLRSTSTATGFRNVAFESRLPKGTKRFKAVIKPSVKAAGVVYSGKEPHFYTAEEASLFANRTYKLLGMDLQQLNSSCRRLSKTFGSRIGTMTADEALRVAREAGLPLDRAIFGRGGCDHGTGYRYVVREERGGDTCVFRVQAQAGCQYVRAEHWPKMFRTAEEAALHLAISRAKADAEVEEDEA